MDIINANPLGNTLDKKLKINEIFYSIQGESSLAGHRTVFIRTSGCHLRCTYCDTKYAYYEGKNSSIAEIIDNISQYNVQYVCITGGEPLLQKNIYCLIEALISNNYKVSLETSGDKDCNLVPEEVLKIIDIKTPDSGEGKAFNFNNIKYLGPNSEFKFVICSEADFQWAVEFLNNYPLHLESIVHFSPSFGQVCQQWLAEELLRRKLPIRLQLQQHKFIWKAETRGV